MLPKPRRRRLTESKTYRIIPSRFPTIDIFEDLCEPEELEILYALESLTNDRLRAEAGELYLLPKEEWVTGPGASVVMAAFTHVGLPSRFSDGSYGVYYAGLSEQTAIRETAFHQARRLKETNEPAIDIEMRCYIGDVVELLDDVRSSVYEELHNPDITTWPQAQAFAATRRAEQSQGLLYNSVRDSDGKCIAVFRPKALQIPSQGPHYIYHWNGSAIDHVRVVSDVISLQ